MKANYKIPFSHFGQLTFSGLIYTDAGEDLYQGKVSIRWNTGTSFEAEIHNGSFHNGIMTYQDGTVRCGNWELILNDAYSGIFCHDGKHLHGCGICYFPGDVHYEGELRYNKPGSGAMFFPNRHIPSHEPAHQNAWDLLITMRQFQGCFSGSWNPEGYPESGRYTFSTGASVSGNFSYLHNENYAGMLLNEKACGIGSHHLTKEMVYTGEYLRGTCSGLATVQHDCGASFRGLWNNGQITEGVLSFTDGTEKSGRNWAFTKIQLHSGHILNGIFCDHNKQPCGIGKVTFPVQKTEFCGEVLNGECKNGIYYDNDGNIVG